jgi:hypothetical protein
VAGTGIVARQVPLRWIDGFGHSAWLAAVAPVPGCAHLLRPARSPGALVLFKGGQTFEDGVQWRYRATEAQ